LPEEMCDSSLPKSFQRAEAYSSLSRLPATYPWIDIGRLEKRILPLLQHENSVIQRWAQSLIEEFAEARNRKK